MNARPDQSATARDRLAVTSINHERARRKLDRAELERARAVVEARAAGLTSREIGGILGLSHVHVLHLARGLAGDTRPDPSATGRGASEPTPMGVLLARALEPTDPPEEPTSGGSSGEPDLSVTGPTGSIALDWVPRPEDIDEDGRVTFQVVSACARIGCSEPAGEGSRFCPPHSRY